MLSNIVVYRSDFADTPFEEERLKMWIELLAAISYLRFAPLAHQINIIKAKVATCLEWHFL